VLLSTPGRVAGAAKDNVGLAAHRSSAACPTSSSPRAPKPGKRAYARLPSRPSRRSFMPRQRGRVPDRIPLACAGSRHAPRLHQARNTAPERQGVCISLLPAPPGAARLPAPVGLTQAKGMPGSGSRGRPDRVDPSRDALWPALDSSAGRVRAGRQADLIGDSRRCGCIDTEASLANPASTLSARTGGRHDRRHRRS